MPILLTNEDIEQVLDMPSLIDELEIAFGDLGRQQGIVRNRSDTGIPRPAQNANYVFKSMEGGYTRRGVYAIRLSSDIITWPNRASGQRKEKLASHPGDRYLGLVLLFSIDNGELLSIQPDGIMQQWRVGATNGVGIRYMARTDARTVGLIGAGNQAGAQLAAACAVRSITSIDVYSPTASKREAFARAWTERLGIPVRPVGSAREAVTGHDIVLCATNSMEPVMEADWLEPGMHLSSLKRFELPTDVYDRADATAIHTHFWEPNMQLMGESDLPDAELWQARKKDGKNSWLDQPEIGRLINGDVAGRSSSSDITCFINNIGTGLQFAAASWLALDKARTRKLGQTLPMDWFTQTVVT